MIDQVKRIPVVLLSLLFAHQLSAEVDFIRVPDGGIQPQAAVGRDGALNLIYFKGDPAGGDLFYVKRPAGAADFNEPIQINQTQGATVAMGTIRGAHFALGKNDRVHVAWMGSGKTGVKVEGKKFPESPMFYTRLNDAGTAFVPERNVIQWTGGLDGGGSLAADSQGTVYVAWHGRAPGSADGEAGRAMFLTVSTDDGKTFARETRANPSPTGACACCGMRAHVDGADNLYLLYRTMSPVSRDMMLLTSTDQGRNFTETPVNRWFTQSCPMSSSTIARGRDGILVSSETNGQIEWTTLSPDRMLLGSPTTVASANAKHPSIATNAKGEVLVAWAEGAGWAKGGALKWQTFGADGGRKDSSSKDIEIPTWSFPTAVNLGGDNFVVIY